MSNREATAAALKRAVIIGPNSRMADELSPLLRAYLPGVDAMHVARYPSPREIAGQLAGSQSICFVDVASDRDQSLQLLSELTRMSSSVQSGNLTRTASCADSAPGRLTF